MRGPSATIHTWNKIKLKEKEKSKKEYIGEKVLKKNEENKKKGSQGGGGKPAHKVHNVVCFILFFYNNRGKGYC